MICTAIAFLRNLLFVLLLGPILFLFIAPVVGKPVALLLCVLVFVYLQFRYFPQLMDRFPRAAFAVRVVRMLGWTIAGLPFLLLLIAQAREAMARNPLAAILPTLAVSCYLTQVLPGMWTRIRHW
jgi:hypothetical protein